MKVAYVRVSSVDQNEARQLEALQDYEIEKWFVDKASGKDTSRPAFQEMLNFVRESDVVYVHSLDRLGRSTLDILLLLKEFEERGVLLVSLKENVDFSTKFGKMFASFCAIFAELERDISKERQEEGIALAKKRGVYKGRRKIEVPDISRWYDLYFYREMSKTDIAKKLGVSYNTLNRLFDDYQKSLKEDK